MKLRLIPPGEFLMGAPDDDPDAQPQEKPQHKVRLTKPFYIGTTEVTVGQFRKFVEDTKYVTQAESDGLGAFDVNPRQRNPANVWREFANSDEQPIRCVSWEDARRFCEWLGKQDGRTYRLPTDAEWEFACRAGTATRYSFGNNFDHAQANAAQPSHTLLRPVAQYPANPFGLFDMHGNVHEICWDGGRTFLKEDVVDPVGPVDQSKIAVVRGGASSASPARLRSSQRYVTDSRVFPDVNFATPVKGFRVVALVNPAKPAELTTAMLTPSELLASPDYEWSPLEDLGEPINTPGYEAGASIAADDLSMLLHANEARPAPGGKLRLWQAWRHTVNEPFEKPVLLDGVINNQPENLSDPTMTADGLTLAFCTRRGDGHGAFDLWISDRPSGDASWSAPVNAGPGVNSNRDEWEPELSADGLTLLFHSGRANENGGTDLWIAHRDSRDKPFGPAENLGPDLNTAGNEGGPALSSDGLTLLFHRIAADATGQLTHWQATRKSVSDPFGNPQPLIIPSLVENRGVSLSLSPAGDWLYCSMSPRDGSPQIGTSRRVLKRNAPTRK